MFLMASSTKLSGAPEMVAAFDQIGLGRWFRYFTGGLELVAAVLLLVPRLAVLGALLLIPTMVAAVASHLFIIGGTATPAVVLLLVAALVVWMRRSQLAAFANREGR
jgi:hypothetical protein